MSSPQDKNTLEENTREGQAKKPVMLPEDEFNRELISHVHPHDWKNPEPQSRYHLVVVGAGTAGLVSAAIAASLGAKVALVERHFMGGDCLNVGCVPSKGVISAARAWHTVKTAQEIFGAPPVGDEPGNFAEAMRRMRKLRAGISPIDGAKRFQDLGVDVFLGHGRFIASDAVEVDGKRLHFRRAIIATGARAAAPPIPGLNEVDYLTNESVFSLTQLPKRLGVIGAGPIGSEMSQAFARLGSDVTVFDRSPHILSREDQDAAAVVQETMQRDGVHLHLGISVQKIEKDGDSIVVVTEKDGKVERTAVDQLLISVGRAPNTNDLGLEAAGVRYGKRGVEVDDRLRTSNPAIYAAGDIASKYQFTHSADFQARMVIRNAFFFGRGKASDLVIPWATYTSPEIAHVGLYEDEAKKQGYDVHTITVAMDDVDRAILDGQVEGFLRIHLKKGTDEILGGTLVAEHAGDMIGPLALACTHRIGLKKFAETMFPYPTQGEIFRKAGDAFNRTLLTSKAEKFFEIWFKIFK